MGYAGIPSDSPTWKVVFHGPCFQTILLYQWPRAAASQVVITSPYLRCIQTALVVCETFKSDLLLDYALSEVYGAPVFEHPPKQETQMDVE